VKDPQTRLKLRFLWPSQSVLRQYGQNGELSTSDITSLQGLQRVRVSRHRQRTCEATKKMCLEARGYQHQLRGYLNITQLPCRILHPQSARCWRKAFSLGWRAHRRRRRPYGHLFQR
jgi:hypothetical protein